MPTLAIQLADLQAEGPIVLAKLASAAPGIDAGPVAATALVDTGATMTVVGQDVVLRLGLQPVGMALVHTPSSSSVECYKYMVRLVLPHDITLDVVALGAPMQGQDIQCLIGRDVLKSSVFTYSGHTNSFTLSF